ncbi:MAG TPA: rhomboid family intramembrane serine protease [Polyangia bacterium]|nr:rhomboid family intramembrane serine protease [Polyangia bacterium]
MFLPLRDDRPRTRFPAATLLLIAANTIVFLYQILLTPQGQRLLVLEAGAIPYEIVNHVDIRPRNLLPLPGSIWTSMFLHGGSLHLIGNMWFLWVFGDNVEEAMGSIRYLLFYFLVGTVGALAQCYAMPDSTAPMIGASGAIAGVLGGYLMLYPRARISTLVMIPFLWPVITLPAWFFLSGWFLAQFMLPGNSGVAWMAHVGGFIAGLGAVRLLAHSTTRRGPPTAPVEYIPPPKRHS